MNDGSMTQTPTDLAWPEHGVTRVPYRVYDDPQIYEREQARLFRGPAWHYLGLDCEIPKPGDYKLNYVGDTPVILVRDERGEVNALVNRCAHRGALVCIDKTGNRGQLTCVYHNWSYNLRGELTTVAFKRGVRGQGGMPEDFDNAKHGLERLQIGRAHV